VVDEASGGPSGVVSFLVQIAANVTVLTSLLVYFGWKRSETHARVLGIDASILGMTTQEYALRSLDALFAPIAVVAVAGLAWLWVNALITRAIAEDRGRAGIRRLARVLGLAWVIVPVVLAGFSWRFPIAGAIVFPLSFALGALLSAYGVYLSRRLPGRRARTPPLPAWQASLSKVFVGIVVTLSLFWSVANYATFLGQRLGAATPALLPSLTRVVVYSPQRLQIEAPAVREEVLEAKDSAYRFRYRGLRLLEHTGGHYFLVSDGWTRRYGVVVVLADDDPVRLEFVRDTRPAGLRPAGARLAGG
jgi:hypothetical protein